MKYFNYCYMASLMALTTVHAAVNTKDPAPEFIVSDSIGVEHRLTDFKGRYVVLEWTRHDCPFVVKHYQHGDMQALQEKLTAAGVVWLQIASSARGKPGYLSAPEAEAMRRQTAAQSTALLLDTSGEIGRAYNARTTPHMFLINPEGILIYQGAIDSMSSVHSSDISQATNYLKAAYESAIAGEPIENSTTTPYGCSVKY